MESAVTSSARNWWVYKGDNTPHTGIGNLPPPPPWREFDGQVVEERPIEDDPQYEKRFGRGRTFQASEKEVEMVNAALYLRRPLLVTGKPGTGKSSLAYAVAHELNLGRVLRWSITSQTTLLDGLYRYDAIGRLQDASLNKSVPNIGRFIRLGPVGTALLPTRIPRVLLIDEIDKSNIDLPNDLLNIFEEGEFEIPELARLSKEQEGVEVATHESQAQATIERGKVKCYAFPFVVLTSNGERELPPAFLRRCLRLDIDEPTDAKLAKIVRAHFGGTSSLTESKQNELIGMFVSRREEGRGSLATDQLLNAIYLITQGVDLRVEEDSKDALIESVWRYLSSTGL